MSPLNRSRYFYSLTDDPQIVFREGGGKAGNLARLTSWNLQVPSAIVVGKSGLRAFLQQAGLANQLQELLEQLQSLSLEAAPFAEKVSQLFLSYPIPEDLKAELEQALQQAALLDQFVAVRSSGLEEDSAEHSFAGQFSSYLFQRGMDQIFISLRRCWASAYSERIVSYRRERKLSMTNIEMGVVIQRMVDATASGVSFSRHPIDFSAFNSVLLSSVWGLGEGLVDGSLDADHYIVARDTWKTESTIVRKEQAIRQSPAGGTVTVPLEPELQMQASLSELQVRLLAEMAAKVEDLAGKPQDLEWAIAGGSIFVLQARPITNLPHPSMLDDEIRGKKTILWDNSNIIESYSGVTTPLTFSFASRAYQLVYLQFCEVIGVPASLIAANQAMFRNMLGLIRGRIYYNLINWYRLVLMLPGSSNNKSFMETMMGVRQQLKPEHQELFKFIAEAPKYSLGDRITLLFKSAVRFLQMDSIVANFNRDFRQIYDTARRQPYAQWSLDQLAVEYHALDDQVLSRWKAPIINDYLCMIFFGLLKKTVESWLGVKDEQSTLQNDLLCGEGGLESTEPTKRLMAIAKHIAEKTPPELRQWMSKTDPQEVWQTMKGGQHAPLKAQFDEFLDAYGFRCVDELKLESQDLHDNPSFVVSMVAGYLRTGSYKTEDLEERERQIRSKAEGLARERLTWWQAPLFFWILRQTRKAVKNRENLRFARTKIFGVCRNLFRAIGSRLAELGVIQQREDIFYLTVEEIFAFLEGRGTDQDLSKLCLSRRACFAHFDATPSPPDRFMTTGAAGLSFAYPALMDFGNLIRAEINSDDPNSLHGTPCCPGIVEGFVRVVKSMADAHGLDGEILVTSRTDPGWVPLYPSCSGLLIERGSLLSHSAVVARELGLPTIVGISGGLMDKLKTGDRVRMDASQGIVKILREPST